MNADEIQQQLISILQRTSEQENEAWERLIVRYQQNDGYLSEMFRAYDCLQKILQRMVNIHQQRDLRQLLQIILDISIEIMHAERGFVLAGDMELARNFDQESISGEYKISLSIAEMVKNTGVAVITDNAQRDQRFCHFDSVHTHRLLSVVCYPLLIKGKIIGVIYLDNRLVRGNFSSEDLLLLRWFADQSAVAIENAWLYQTIERQTTDLEQQNKQLLSQVKLQTEELANLRNHTQTNYHNIYAKSKKMQEVFHWIERIKDTNFPVLIYGESGTGKELVAQAIHSSSERKNLSFISENCAAIPETLFESELFGHEKGAFTGANHTKKGLLEQANGGTLFLDEIAELSTSSQKKLLRVLAEKKIRRLGSSTEINLDVRIIAATNRDLKKMVTDGEFREDLLYRLNAVEIYVPPLRERREDIPLLVEYFLHESAKIAGSIVKKIDKSMLSYLIGYDWPGNVRQLRNEILRMATLSEEFLQPCYLSPQILPAKRQSKEISNLPSLLHETEKNEILKALSLCEDNKSKASQLLGISRFALLRKMEKYHIGSITK